MSDCICIDTLSLIFKWSPVRSLLRFRRICKWAKEIIDSDYFQREHLSVQKPGFISQFEDPGEYLAIHLRTGPIVHRFRPPLNGHLVGTLNGIVCLYDNTRHFLIWNPWIRLYSILPEHNIQGLDYGVGEDDPPHFGFWIDPSIKNFKIVAFKLLKTVDPWDGGLYSSIRGEWIPLDLDNLEYCRIVRVGPPVMIGAVAHWLTGHEQGYNIEKRVISFDFDQEIFDLIELPHFEYSWDYELALCNVQGALSFVDWDLRDRPRCDVYSMQDGGWVRMFGIHLSTAIGDVFWVLERIEGRGRALAASKGDFVFYDTNDGCNVLQTEIDYARVLLAYGYVESLLFP